MSTCNCDSKSTLIFPCSGAADVGELADRTARKLTVSGTGKMYCLAAIGGKVQQFIDTTREADRIIIIDGCSNKCAEKTLATAGVAGYGFDLEELRFQKGESPASCENIDKVAAIVQSKIKDQNHESGNRSLQL